MATTLSTDTARFPELLIRQREEAEIERKAEKMFNFLCETDKTERWAVWMRFDDHRKEKMVFAGVFHCGANTGRRAVAR